MNSLILLNLLKASERLHEGWYTRNAPGSRLKHREETPRRDRGRKRAAASAGLFLDGLLSEERRKTGWMRAEAVGDPGPWRQQAILGRSRWDADDLRDIVRDSALETLADSGPVRFLHPHTGGVADFRIWGREVPGPPQ
jgi:hypothetical protein